MGLMHIPTGLSYLGDIRTHEIFNEKLLAGCGWKLVKTRKVGDSLVEPEA